MRDDRVQQEVTAFLTLSATCKLYSAFRSGSAQAVNSIFTPLFGISEAGMDQRIETVIALMKQDLKRRLRLSKMAREVNLSPARLCCLFKAETGTPPARYLRQLRMRDAATMLEETFLSVKEIMVQVGFTDESHFVRDFKRIKGLTPTQYRKERRSAENGKASETESNFRPTINKKRQ